jgi:competence protein ComEA
MQRILGLIGIMTVILVFIVYPSEENETNYVGIENEVNMLEVTITGEVYFPGTYYFYEDTTYYDLIKQAGGLKPEADDALITYQKSITTETHVIIPSQETSIEQIVSLVNVNEASFQELLEIDGMTETRAANLIIYRENYGAFQSIDDLIHVKYIGAETLEKIRPYITV